MTPPLFKLRGISFGYADHKILDGIDLDLGGGERMALVGGNGTGKSTLLHLMVGLHTPNSGSVEAFGHRRIKESDFEDLRARVGLSFQDPDDQLFCPTVLEDVIFGPLNLGKNRSDAVTAAHEVLAALGIEQLAERVTHRLSGGEKRLVSLATILSMEPEVLLLDEPTTGLDDAAARRLIDHLGARNGTMIFVSHDRIFIEALATRAIYLQDGRLADAELHAHPHSHVHTHVHIHTPGMANHGHGEAPPEHPDHEHVRAGSKR
jgi:cobalt/nickel transport system ATP-binding protein